MFRKYYHKYVLGLSTYPQDIINDTTTEAIFTFNIKFWKKINRKYEVHEVFHELNHYHEIIKLTIELSPSKLLHTQLINVERIFITKVYKKESKIHTHWLSKILK